MCGSIGLGDAVGLGDATLDGSSSTAASPNTLAVPGVGSRSSAVWRIPLVRYRHRISPEMVVVMRMTMVLFL